VGKGNCDVWWLVWKREDRMEIRFVLKPYKYPVALPSIHQYFCNAFSIQVFRWHSIKKIKIIKMKYILLVRS
jgi:hypothetical protein